MTDRPVKIALRGADDEIETVWANRTDEDGRYVIDNVPWYAYGVSLGDTVAARPDANGYLEMTEVVRKCGNRTLRVILEVTEAGAWTPESRAVVAGIRQRGADIENMDDRLVAITAPPAVDLLALGRYIDEAGFTFEYADPTYEELFPA